MFEKDAQYASWAFRSLANCKDAVTGRRRKRLLDAPERPVDMLLRDDCGLLSCKPVLAFWRRRQRMGENMPSSPRTSDTFLTNSV